MAKFVLCPACRRLLRSEEELAEHLAECESYQAETEEREGVGSGGDEVEEVG